MALFGLLAFAAGLVNGWALRSVWRYIRPGEYEKLVQGLSAGRAVWIPETGQILVGRARYAVEFLSAFPQTRGHFRMTGPVRLADGTVTCEITVTTRYIRSAIEHLRAAHTLGPAAMREYHGKALALLDMADAELEVKEMLDR